MVELVVVMLVVGIIAFVALPQLGLLSEFDEVGFRDKLRSAVEFARKAAVAQRRYTCVSQVGNDLVLTVDLNVPESYVAGTCPASVLALPVADTACSPAATNRVCAPSGVALAGPASLTFSPLGVPSAGASFTVTGGSTLSFTVEAETGYVH